MHAANPVMLEVLVSMNRYGVGCTKSQAFTATRARSKRRITFILFISLLSNNKMQSLFSLKFKLKIFKINQFPNKEENIVYNCHVMHEKSAISGLFSLAFADHRRNTEEMPQSDSGGVTLGVTTINLTSIHSFARALMVSLQT